MNKWDNNWQFRNDWGIVLLLLIKSGVIISIILPLLGLLALIENGLIPNYPVPYPFGEWYVMFSMLGGWLGFSFFITIKIMKKYKILIPIISGSVEKEKKN